MRRGRWIDSPTPRCRVVPNFDARRILRLVFAKFCSLEKNAADNSEGGGDGDGHDNDEDDNND